MQLPTIKVIVLDDQVLARDGIRHQLERAPAIDIVGEGSAGEHLLPLIRQYQPDVVLLDLEMPQKEGESIRNGATPFRALPAVQQIQREYPHTRILIVSQHLDRGIVEAVMDSGANGYLLKDDAMSEQLVMAVRTVHNGGVCVSPDVSRLMMRSERKEPGLDLLTERQIEVLRQMILYPDTKVVDMAENLRITESTFRNHLRDIRERLGVQSTTAAVVKGVSMGIAPLSAISFGRDVGDI